MCEETKFCPKCSVTKNVTEFSKSSRAPDGLYGYCKECDSKRQKDIREKNKNREAVLLPEIKTCPGCALEKPGEMFSKKKNNGDGLNSCCKTCALIRNRKSLYGATPEWIAAALEAQGGACAIFKFIPGQADRPLHLDHEHIEGWKEMLPEERKLYIRGFLHSNCNLGLGYFRDSVAIVRSAIEYLNGPTTGILYKTHLSKVVREKILVNQNYLCKICSVDLHGKKVCMDHDHLTNVIRGALCNDCNCGLGQFDDSVVLLQKAADYLVKSEGTTC